METSFQQPLPSSGFVELPLRLFGEHATGHHGPADELSGDLLGEGAAVALYPLGGHQHAICNKRSRSAVGRIAIREVGLVPDILCQTYVCSCRVHHGFSSRVLSLTCYTGNASPCSAYRKCNHGPFQASIHTTPLGRGGRAGTAEHYRASVRMKVCGFNSDSQLTPKIWLQGRKGELR